MAVLDVISRELGERWWTKPAAADMLGRFIDVELVYWLDQVAEPKQARLHVLAVLRTRGIAYESPARRARRASIQTTAEQEVEAYERVGDNKPEPSPEHNDSQPIAELVAEDLILRMEVGTRKYGTPLQANNGRVALRDAYQEALDLVCYLKQHLVELDDHYHLIADRLAMLVAAYVPKVKLEQHPGVIEPEVWQEIIKAIQGMEMESEDDPQVVDESVDNEDKTLRPGDRP